MSQSPPPKKKSKVGLIIGLMLVLLLVVGGGGAVVVLTGVAGAGAWFYMASAEMAGPVAETSVVHADDARQPEIHNEHDGLAEAHAEVSASPHSEESTDFEDNTNSDDALKGEAEKNNDGIADAGPPEDEIGIDDGASVPARRPPPPPAVDPPAVDPPAVDPVGEALGDLPSGDEGADDVLDDVLDDNVSIKIMHVNPGASVMIDGVGAGKTPLKVDVASGSHQIRIQDGKATGAFNIDAGFMQDKWCYASKGKKVESVGC